MEVRYSSVGAVVGATWPQQLKELRERMPNICFSGSGLWSSGRRAEDVTGAFDKNGLGAIVNASRSLMCAYKSKKWEDKFSEEEFDIACREEAIDMRNKLQNV